MHLTIKQIKKQPACTKRFQSSSETILTIIIILDTVTRNPQGKRNRGRPKNNWRRSAEQELRQIGLQWTQIEGQAQEREQWKKTVDNLRFI